MELQKVLKTIDKQKFFSGRRLSFTKKGDLLIEDTTGFHKGLIVYRNQRSFTFHYAISNIGNPEKNFFPPLKIQNIDSDPIFSFSEKNKNFSNNYSIIIF